MKVLIGLVFLLIAAGSAFSQGTVLFNNRVPGVVDARMLMPDGTGIGEGWIAQLYGGPEGSFPLLPLFPTTTFRTSTSAARGYVHPVIVTVPNVPPGARATIDMRFGFQRETGELVMCGRSNPITVTLGGGIIPPANLVGMNGFTIIGPTACIPEPETTCLIMLGFAAALWARGQSSLFTIGTPSNKTITRSQDSSENQGVE